MSIWAELIMTFVVNAAWLVLAIAAGAWLLARWLRGAGPAAVCWVWRAALLSSVLLPLLSTAWVVAGQQAIVVADGSGPQSHGVWLALAVIFSASIVWRVGRTLAERWALQRTLQTAHEVASLPPWAAQVVAECSAKFVAGVVTIRAGAGEAAYTAGWRRPVLVLPQRYFGPLEVPGMASIVGHEAAHIERRDYAWNLLIETATALIAFHPLLPWMKGRANLAREQACDAMVVRRLVPAVDYADHLLQFARAQMGYQMPRQAMTVLERNTLEARLRFVLSHLPSVSARSTVLRGALALVLFASLAAALPWGALRVDLIPLPASITPPVQRFAPPPPPPPPPPPGSRRRA